MIPPGAGSVAGSRNEHPPVEPGTLCTKMTQPLAEMFFFLAADRKMLTLAAASRLQRPSPRSAKREEVALRNRHVLEGDDHLCHGSAPARDLNRINRRIPSLPRHKWPHLRARQRPGNQRHSSSSQPLGIDTRRGKIERRASVWTGVRSNPSRSHAFRRETAFLPFLAPSRRLFFVVGRRPIVGSPSENALIRSARP